MPDEATVMPAEGAKAATFSALASNENATSSTKQHRPITDNNKVVRTSQPFYNHNYNHKQQPHGSLLPPISTMLLADNASHKAFLPANHLYNQHHLHSQILHNANTTTTIVETTKTTPTAAVALINHNSSGNNIKKCGDNINIIENVNRQNATIWKVFSASGGRVLRLIETNSKKANWMKNIRLAATREAQNLVACQVGLLKIIKIKKKNYCKKRICIFFY